MIKAFNMAPAKPHPAPKTEKKTIPAGMIIFFLVNIPEYHYIY